MTNPQILPLTEYQTTRLAAGALPQALGELLYRRYEQQQHILTVEFPTVRSSSEWRITPQGWVGHIPLTPELRLVIQPKVPLDNLFGMLTYAYRLRAFHLPDGLTHCTSLAEFYEQLAAILARRVLARTRQGLHRAYLPRQEALPYVRGRLNLAPAGYTTALPLLHCHYEEDTADLPDNQLLLWTLHQIARGGLCRPPVMADVRRAYHALAGSITLTPPRPGNTPHSYSRLNEDYAPMHALCDFFLRNSGPGHQTGEHNMIPFLINMAGLYELFVAEWLRAHLPAPWHVKAQEALSLGDDAPLQLRLDLVLYDGQNRPRAVLDTKYKAGGSVAPADFNQAVTYAQARGCREAVLVYPVRLPRPVHTTLHGLHVRSLTFALDGNLDSNGRAFTSHLLAAIST